MAEIPCSSGLRWAASGWLARHAYAVLLAMLLVAIAAPILGRSASDWHDVYVPAGGRWLAGAAIYQGIFVYPPINALLAAPFAGLERNAGRLAWYALNALALFALLRGCWRLAGGGALQGTTGREHAVLWLGLGCGLFYALDAASNLQTDLIVAALVILGCQALVARREIGGGLLVGLAAGIKCTPLLFAPYLLLRKRWLAAALVALTAVGVNLLPDLVRPPASPGWRFVEWGRHFLVPMTTRDYDLGSWYASVQYNHSIAGLTNRLLNWQRPAPGGSPYAMPSPTRVRPGTLRAIVVGAMLGAVGVTLVCGWIGGRRTRGVQDLREDISGEKRFEKGSGTEQAAASSVRTASQRQALEFATVLILMLLLSPQSSKAHFCTLLLPGFCLARQALVTRSRIGRALVGAAVLCALVSNKDLVGGHIYGWVIWHGSVTWTAVSLLAAAWLALVRTRGNARQATSTDVRTKLRQAA